MNDRSNKEWEIEAKEYTEKQWGEEMKAPAVVIRFPKGPFALGRILPCPHCGTVGFYGPRIDESGEVVRKYRACKYCGFWQEAFGAIWEETNGKAYRCVAVHCDKCGVYDWRVPWAKRLGNCENCNVELKQVSWASDDPNHPFNTLKEEMSRIHQKGLTSN